MHTVTDGPLAQPCPLSVEAPLDDVQEIYVRGLLALRNGDAAEAVLLLTHALRRQPGHTGMQRNLLRALLIAEHFEQVLILANSMLANSVLRKTPGDAELHFARGTALNAVGQPSQACSAFAHALALQPDHAASWLNMGNASADLDDLESAETLYRTAIRLDPNLTEAHASMGFILTMQGRLPEAIEACETAIRQRPDFPQAHWNLAIAMLLGGDLPRGFAEYEWRKRHRHYQVDFPAIPGRVWDGAGAGGQTILVRAEQGFGDVIQFARYLPLLRDAGLHPVLVCAAALVPLVQSMPGIRTASSSGPVPDYDCWIDQISLPLLFGTTLDTIPAAGGYLSANPTLAEAWRARLPEGRKAGLVFAGNPRHPADRRRSIPTDFIMKLPDIPGVSFVNLQYGKAGNGLGLPDLTNRMTDYAETAALIENLDLVITVDTSVAHLAGALGKPVWILLPHAPDWRWLLHRSDSPWYRSARLFRQPNAGDWNSVLTDVITELNCLWK